MRRRFVARTIAISHLQRDRYRALAGSGRNLVVVHSGVTDPGLPSAAARERTRADVGVEDGAVLAVSVVPMRRGKGQDLLLDALATVSPGCRSNVVLAGDGPLRPWLAARADQDDVLSARVRFLPRHDDVVGLLGAADIVLHTTRSDALPASLMQSLAVGAPTVASGVGGIPEIVTRDTGVLVPLDADRIADAVARLAADPDGRARMGAAARARYLAEFEATGWARRLRGVYDSVLAGR